VGVAAVHYRVYDTLAWFGYAISIALLILVFPFGTEVLGAKRWLRIGGFQFQPSELAKLWTIFVLARHLDQKRLDLSRAKNWVLPILITFFPMALVLKEPDLATSLSFFVFFVAMMFWAGMPITDAPARALAGHERRAVLPHPQRVAVRARVRRAPRVGAAAACRSCWCCSSSTGR
jgi:cell division protein FtsW (lipid II flippase)